MKQRSKSTSVSQPTVEPLENRMLLSGVTAIGSVAMPTTGPIVGWVSPITPGPIGTPLPVHAIENVAFDDELATLPALPSIPQRRYVGTIEWGDGTSSAATFVSPSAASSVSPVVGAVEVFGSHKYVASGTFHVVIGISAGIITPVAGPVASTGSGVLIFLGSVSTTATVAASPLTFVAKAGVTYDGSVGSFATTLELSKYSTIATITWGDGTSSTVTIVDDGDGVYHVVGAHDYSTAGKYAVHINVTAETVPPTGTATSTAAGSTGVIDPVVILVASFDSTADVISDIVTAA